MTSRCPLIAPLEELDLGLSLWDFGGGVVEALAMLIAGDDAVVPELEQLLVGHRGEFVGTHLQKQIHTPAQLSDLFLGIFP